MVNFRLKLKYKFLQDTKLSQGCQKAPSPDWGRLGWGVSRKGLLPMSHSVLDTESPASIEGFKFILSFAIRPTMRL